MWAGAPTMAIADGVDEVHKVTVARNVLKRFEPHDGLWPTDHAAIAATIGLDPLPQN